jgi:hypothetical protein
LVSSNRCIRIVEFFRARHWNFSIGWILWGPFGGIDWSLWSPFGGIDWSLWGPFGIGWRLCIRDSGT